MWSSFILTARSFLIRPRIFFEDALSRGQILWSLVIGSIALYPEVILWPELLWPRIRNPFIYLILAILAAVAYFILISLLINLVCLLLGGKGTAADTLKVFGYTYLPGILGGAFILLLFHLLIYRPGRSPYPADGTPMMTMLVSTLAAIICLAFWDVFLKALALRVVHKVSIWRLALIGTIVLIASGVLSSSIHSLLLERTEFNDPSIFSGMSGELARKMETRQENLARIFKLCSHGEGTWKLDVSIEMRILHRPPHRGDIVVFEKGKNGELGLARIVGLPGEIIEVVDGEVIVNGRRISEPYVRERKGLTMPPIELGRKDYYLLGDERSLSPQTYEGGIVKQEAIRGAYFETVLFLQKSGLM